MARDHYIGPTSPASVPFAARLGAGSGAANNLSSLDFGKIVKLAGESRYDLAVAGDEIEGTISSVEMAIQNGYTIGGVRDYFGESNTEYFTADGLQGTPGTGSIVIGDIIVAGSITAKGTKLAAYPKVCKATTPANVLHRWRVVSLGTGAGAVGTTIVAKRVA